MLVCPICGAPATKAVWHDVVRRNGEAVAIQGIVEYSEADDTFHLDDLIKEQESMIVGFDDNVDDVILFSFNIDTFTKEELDRINFGEEDLGARCIHCNSFI